jgi:hypothetical protein
MATRQRFVAGRTAASRAPLKLHTTAPEMTLLRTSWKSSFRRPGQAHQRHQRVFADDGSAGADQRHQYVKGAPAELNGRPNTWKPLQRSPGSVKALN